MNIRLFLGTLADLLYPRRCPVCDRAVSPFGSLICKACENKFVYIDEPYCMKCGKQITNPVSQFFGMEPECGGHHYVNPFESEEELKEAVERYRRDYLQKIVWEGWIIKSAITEKEKIV